MTTKQPTVLVSGAHGFTGTYLIPALRQRGYHVVGLTHRTLDDSSFITCDLLDNAMVHDIVQQVRPTHVIHLAALSFVEIANKQDFYHVNVFGTQNLLEALATLSAPPTQVLLASSANVYGNPKVVCIDESIAPNPVNHYAISKLAMEHMAKTWFDALPIIITRPFNYTGPYQAERFLVPKIVAHFAQQAPSITLGNTNIERDFSDVQFVVESYCRLLECSTSRHIVNVCSGHSCSIHQILHWMATIAGYEIQVNQDPNLMRANDLTKLIGSNAKLFQLIGEIPITPFEHTLRQMYDTACTQSR